MTTSSHQPPEADGPGAPGSAPGQGPRPGPESGAPETYGAAVFRTLDRGVRLTLYRLLAVPLALGLVLAFHPWTWGGGSSGSSGSSGFGSDSPYATGGADGSDLDGTATDDTSTGAGGADVTDEPTPTETTPTEDPQSEAAALDALVSQSADERSQVSAAVADAEQCGPDAGLGQDATTLQGAADTRTSLAEQATALPMDAVAGGSDAAQLLSTALDASSSADADYARWATALADGTCRTGATHDQSDYVSGGQDSTTAQQAKSAFVDAWNPIAQQYGLATRSVDEF
ncbi:hypothetical protein V2S66_11460 [Streptomyces sp. V4-01]|uniref:Uncharacterized protein n=1 Tax=Actinacidiphila polyblastidii TaxID=3110430 RepID=A0ABU7P9T5_9ACTN|nr:hypothetical protein [Streptomyces sp. V4-01]